MVEPENKDRRAYATCPVCGIKGPGLVDTCDICHSPVVKRSLSAGEEEDFRRSLDSYGFAMSMRDELPDGMPQELGEAVQDISNGSRPKDWSTDQKLSFTESVKEIFTEYGFGW